MKILFDIFISARLVLTHILSSEEVDADKVIQLRSLMGCITVGIVIDMQRVLCSYGLKHDVHNSIETTLEWLSNLLTSVLDPEEEQTLQSCSSKNKVKPTVSNNSENAVSVRLLTQDMLLSALLSYSDSILCGIDIDKLDFYITKWADQITIAVKCKSIQLCSQFLTVLCRVGFVITVQKSIVGPRIDAFKSLFKLLVTFIELGEIQLVDHVCSIVSSTRDENVINEAIIPVITSRLYDKAEDTTATSREESDPHKMTNAYCSILKSNDIVLSRSVSLICGDISAAFIGPSKHQDPLRLSSILIGLIEAGGPNHDIIRKTVSKILSVNSVTGSALIDSSAVGNDSISLTTTQNVINCLNKLL